MSSTVTSRSLGSCGLVGAVGAGGHSIAGDTVCSKVCRRTDLVFGTSARIVETSYRATWEQSQAGHLPFRIVRGAKRKWRRKGSLELLLTPWWQSSPVGDKHDFRSDFVQNLKDFLTHG